LFLQCPGINYSRFSFSFCQNTLYLEKIKVPSKITILKVYWVKGPMRRCEYIITMDLKETEWKGVVSIHMG
jgi:hypothetical protein